jgi:hypothetical protein
VFSTLLNQITSFFSKPFLIGALLPTLFFVVINSAVLAWAYVPFGVWAAAFLSRDSWDQIGLLLRGVLPIFAFSYVLWGLNPALLALLEGRLLPQWFEDLLRQHQHGRFREKQERVDQWRTNRRNLENAKSGWEDALKQARQEGTKKTTNTYKAMDSITQLKEKRRNGEFIEMKEFTTSLMDLERELKANNADLPGPNGDYALDNDHTDFLRLVTYSLGRAESEYFREFTERDEQFSYFEIRATTFGNLSESVLGYAQSRYGMDTNMTWSRLLHVIKKQNDGFFDSLMDQKGQLDFIVALYWLTIVSTAAWLFLLPVISLKYSPLLAVGILGPTAAAMLYWVAVNNFRFFADTERAAIDLYRLRLLEQLELSAPPSLKDEQQIWRGITQVLTFRDSVNLTYRKKSGDA